MCNQFSLWRKDVYQLIPSKGNKGTPILTFLKAFKAQVILYTGCQCMPTTILYPSILENTKKKTKKKQNPKVLERAVPAEKAGESCPN